MLAEAAMAQPLTEKQVKAGALALQRKSRAEGVHASVRAMLTRIRKSLSRHTPS